MRRHGILSMQDAFELQKYLGVIEYVKGYRSMWQWNGFVAID